jgi:hypothetical protein
MPGWTAVTEARGGSEMPSARGHEMILAGADAAETIRASQLGKHTHLDPGGLQ